MIYYLNSSSSGGSSPQQEDIIFENGVWNLNNYDLVPSVAAPSGFIISDNMIISESASNGRNSGFVILPKDTTAYYYINIVLKGTNVSSGGQYQFGRCNTDADAYECAYSGNKRQTYYEGSVGYNRLKIGYETINPNSAFFIAFGKDLGIISITAVRGGN